MAAIGIDLGTTNSCVAVYRKNKVEVIVNNEGNRVTPSFVSFTEDDERLVGDAAKHEASTNFGNTLFQMKRFIGRTHDDPIVQADIKMWPFHVIDDNNKPKIEVRLKNNRNVEFKREILSSEDVSAMVLGSLRDAAEVRLHPLRVTGAVITVPAYFNNSQRKATLLAGKIAGLNVLQMINEPTAAAIAYEMDREGRDGQNALIFDLGGGTFDVSIVTIHNKKIEVKAVGGDTHLGGDDFDNRLIEHCVAEFNEKNNCDMSNDKIGKQRLRRQCEEAKRMLSAKTSTTVQVDALHNGITFKSRITRAKFEDLNYDLFSKITPIIESTLLDAEMKKKDIDSVVLIGGSTRIPKVRQIIENLFGGNKLNMTINPDEAVAWGAAVLADKLSSKSSLEANKLVLQDVAPLSLGWKDVYDGMVTVVKRNTKIPTEQWGDARTTADDQISARFQIYEGERPAAEDNHFLGSFLLDEIPAAPKGVEQLKIFFNLDENGILTVKARIASTGREKQITIGYGGRFDDTDVELMVKKAENFKIDDAAWQDRKKQVNNLEEFAYSVKRAVGEEKFRNVGYQNRQNVIYKCNEIISWIDLNRNPGIYQTRQKTENLEETCRPVFSLVPGGIGLLLELKK